MINLYDKGQFFKLVGKLSLNEIKPNSLPCREVRFIFNEIKFKILVYSNSYATFGLEDGIVYEKLINWEFIPMISWVNISNVVNSKRRLIINTEDINNRYDYEFKEVIITKITNESV